MGQVAGHKTTRRGRAGKRDLARQRQRQSALVGQTTTET